MALCTVVYAQERQAELLQPTTLQKKTYYVEPGSFGTKRETGKPEYVRNASQFSGSDKNATNWLDIGIESRGRVEFRKNDIRRPESFNEDIPLLIRHKVYFGINKILDPLRLSFEFGDSRRYFGHYALETREVNRMELMQGFGELNFNHAFKKDPLGNVRPLSIRFGRMAFDFLDRRLICMNSWRNTAGNFTGIKIAIGQDANDWQIDGLILKPILIKMDQPDKTDGHRLLLSAIGHWRKWSDIITIEPYYLRLDQSPAVENNYKQRKIHSLGMRLYGWNQNSTINFDVSSTYQFGNDDGLKQQAWALNSEMGYTFKSNRLKPRISAFIGYVSGDKNPNDQISNRFERYFGFSRPWSSDDYVVMENIFTPKIKVEWQAKVKHMNFKFDSGYSFYWLASKTDRLNNLLAGSAYNRDKTGNSGGFLGHGLDFRTRFNPSAYLTANFGFTHYTMGTFIKQQEESANNESANNSNFVYLELTINAFDLLKKH
ncbi:MAG: alginate export family protein [Sphingobacteriaceae bacterium]